MTPRTAAIVITYGNHDFTHAVLSDLNRERAYTELVVVDNHDPTEPDRDTLNAEGPYVQHVGEHVLRPGRNLGWAHGCNHAAPFVMRELADCDSLLFVDNDSRVSPGFVSGLRSTWKSTGAALVCPTYNDDWTHQMFGYEGPAAKYRAVDRSHLVPFADGAALFIPRWTIDSFGLLDADMSPRYGWGIDIDYAMRVRAAGNEVRVTELSYLEHFRASTMSMIEPGYFDNADSEFRIAMAGRYGADWIERVWQGFPLPDSYQELRGLER